MLDENGELLTAHEASAECPAIPEDEEASPGQAQQAFEWDTSGPSERARRRPSSLPALGSLGRAGNSVGTVIRERVAQAKAAGKARAEAKKQLARGISATPNGGAQGFEARFNALAEAVDDSNAAVPSPSPSQDPEDKTLANIWSRSNGAERRESSQSTHLSTAFKELLTSYNKRQALPGKRAFLLTNLRRVTAMTADARTDANLMQLDDLLVKDLKCKFFKRFSKEVRLEMCRHMVSVSVRKDRPVFRQGEEGDLFYIVATGRCRVDLEKEDGRVLHLKTLKKGDSFGEIALINSELRSATVLSIDDSELLALDKNNFLAILKTVYGHSLTETVTYLRSLEPFKECSTDHLTSISPFFRKIELAPGALLYPDTDEAVNFVLDGTMVLYHPGRVDNDAIEAQIASETAVVIKDRKEQAEMRVKLVKQSQLHDAIEIARLGPRSFFGESCILQHFQRGWVVNATQAVTVLSILKTNFLNHVDASVLQLIRKEMTFKIQYYDESLKGHMKVMVKTVKKRPSLRPFLQDRYKRQSVVQMAQRKSVFSAPPAGRRKSNFLRMESVSRWLYRHEEERRSKTNKTKSGAAISEPSSPMFVDPKEKRGHKLAQRHIPGVRGAIQGARLRGDRSFGARSELNSREHTY